MPRQARRTPPGRGARRCRSPAWPAAAGADRGAVGSRIRAARCCGLPTDKSRSAARAAAIRRLRVVRHWRRQSPGGHERPGSHRAPGAYLAAGDPRTDGGRQDALARGDVDRQQTPLCPLARRVPVRRTVHQLFSFGAARQRAAEFSQQVSRRRTVARRRPAILRRQEGHDRRAAAHDRHARASRPAIGVRRRSAAGSAARAGPRTARPALGGTCVPHRSAGIRDAFDDRARAMRRGWGWSFRKMYWSW